MSIAVFDSEREARSWINKHLFQMHQVNTSMLGVHLEVEQLFKLHSMLHMDDFALPPHTHADEDVRSISPGVPVNYLKELVDMIMEDGEE